MENQSFLVFSLHGSLYAVDARGVQEIIWLPELTPLEEIPAYIPGVISLRKKIIPVMDLNIRFGYIYQRYLLSDSVIVVETREWPTGLIVNDVLDVVNIEPQNIEPPLLKGGERKTYHHFVAGEAKVGNDIIMILNHEAISDFGFQVELGPEGTAGEEEIKDEAAEPKLRIKRGYFCPEADERERTVFHERALNLMRPVDEVTYAGMMPVAVVGIGNEYFGIDLEFVREFSEIHNLTPIPCCPRHIVGNMNLRGDVITLIDIRNLLNVVGAAHSKSEKVLVACADNLIAGIAVDDVFDVIYLNPAVITPVPSAVRVKAEYVKGTAPYRERMMTVLDLKKVISREDIAVNEEA